MTGNPLELFRKFFGAVRAFFWLWGSFLAPHKVNFLVFPIIFGKGPDYVVALSGMFLVGALLESK